MMERVREEEFARLRARLKAEQVQAEKRVAASSAACAEHRQRSRDVSSAAPGVTSISLQGNSASGQASSKRLRFSLVSGGTSGGVVLRESRHAHKQERAHAPAHAYAHAHAHTHTHTYICVGECSLSVVLLESCS